MADPYEVLGLGPDADEETIRRQYLERVRRHSPERDPARFAEIREAYDQLRDPVVRLKSQLFNQDALQTLEGLLAEARPSVRDRRLPTEFLLSLAKP